MTRGNQQIVRPGVITPAESLTIDVGETTIHAERAGSGPPVLLLHGFPQTLRMWRHVAPLLAAKFSVVCADLRGYGRSGCPPSAEDHWPYSKRAMAEDLVVLMAKLGFERFSIVGHDRGGRVAYRAALDYPERIEHLAVLDIVPVNAAWERADDRFALGFWPWSLLAEAAPLPERLISAAPDAIINHALSTAWGTPQEVFSDEARAEYLAQLADGDHVHAICEEYRAAAGIDRDHDNADRGAGRRIACPVLALWSAHGPVGSWYLDEGGPLELWRELAPDLSGQPVDGGHFFPEERPHQTAAALSSFLYRS